MMSSAGFDLNYIVYIRTHLVYGWRGLGSYLDNMDDIDVVELKRLYTLCLVVKSERNRYR